MKVWYNNKEIDLPENEHDKIIKIIEEEYKEKVQEEVEEVIKNANKKSGTTNKGVRGKKGRSRKEGNLDLYRETSTKEPDKETEERNKEITKEKK